VYMAEQEEPVRRRVALKIIKLGMDTRSVVARFQAERQALALMDHPNIAKVLDGGAARTGRPYFVMELVRGVPITRFCVEAKLATEERLRLFMQVCQAIQHAHQKGIIHRDLKPSNILVTVNDGAPTPKIIDFGIAKATQGKLTDATIFTAFEQFIGTPVYMSPEQAEMSSLDIDTRSDIYSLGVLLYELLTGRPPFDPKKFAEAGVESIRQQIREIEPPRPSARLSTLDDDERTTIAKLRATASSELSLILRGDLDWIVMRCIEKDRTRRYDTANGLAMDIQRYLRNEPVTARPPSTGYLLQKLIRRHRVGFAATTAIFGVVVLGAIVSGWQAVRAGRAERKQIALRVESDRARADSEQARERAVAAEKSAHELRQRTLDDYQLSLKRSSRADFSRGSRLLDEGNAAEGLAYLVRAARSDPHNSVITPRLVSALVMRNFLLPDRAPLKLSSAVRVISCTREGSAVWILGEDGIVRVLDGHGVSVMREFSFPHRALHLALAERNREVFAVYLGDHSLLVCDADTGRPRTAAIHPKDRLANDPIPRLSADGRWLAAAGEGEVWIWDATNGELRATLPHPRVIRNVENREPGQVSAFDFSPDSRRIATSAYDNYSRIWSVPDGAPLTERLPSGDNETRAVRFSPDGRFIVSSTSAGVQVRDAETGKPVGPFLPHNGRCDAAIFTPDSRRVISMSIDRTVKVWDVATGAPAFPPLVHGSSLDQSGSRLQVSDDSNVLFTTCADGFTRVWDLNTGRLLAEPALQSEQAPRSALSCDGTRVFVGLSSGVVFSLRVQRGGAQPLVLPRGNSVADVTLVDTPPFRLRQFTTAGMEIIDIASGRKVAGGFAFPESISRGLLRFDGRFLAVQTRTGRKQLWQLTEGRVRAVDLEDAPGGRPYYQFSEAGDCLSINTTGLNDIRVWHVRTGRPVASAMHLDAPIYPYSPSFSPDGTRLAAGAKNGTARVWDVATGQLLLDLKPHPNLMVTSATFGPDGMRLATSIDNGEVRLWDALTGRPASPVLHHRTRANVAAFSSDGRILATTSYDGTARMWDGRDGAAIGEPIVHAAPLLNVLFNGNGSRIATVSGDGVGRVSDPRSGLPVTELLPHHVRGVSLGHSRPGQYCPGDGRYMCTASPQSIFVWAVPPDHAGAPVPAWLLNLATVCAGKRLTPDGVLADASDEGEKIEEVRREIAALPADAPFAEWGKWFFADRATRSIAPGFTITPAEAERLALVLKGKSP
ncbi:MAG: protein kinase, partial [Verrucomicrobia bacterium]|nr:protein kinase [Verrucomicrobiota bacterium]